MEDVDTEDSSIALEYDGNGDIILARTDIPGYGFTMHELTYKDGLIDTDAYSTDWSTAVEPYKLQFAYEEDNGIVISSEGERLEGSKPYYPCEYEYNDNGDLIKITSTNPKGVFLVCEFEYTSLGQVGKEDMVKSGFRKWQEFSVIEEALKNCY